jgi:hypothetical protein
VSEELRLSTCPPWCADDHDFQPASGGHPEGIGHHSTLRQLPTPKDGEALISLSMWEVGQHLGPAEVVVTVDGNLTPAQARRIAAAILEAADLADGGAA